MYRKKTTVIIGVLALLAILIRLAFFFISTTTLPTSSDEALSILQAKQIIAGHTPLLVMANTYQFPVESYLSVPFVKHLPRNAFGARLIPLLLGLGTTAVLVLILSQIAPFKSSWPGLILIIVPSAYLLMHQSAYMLPQHNAFLLLSSLSVLCVILHGKGAYRLLLAFCAGVFGGLAFSTHMLALPFAIMIVLFLFLSERWKVVLLSGPVLLAGMVIGSSPYWLARILLPGAYGAVTRTVDLAHAWSRLWPRTLLKTLPQALGVNPCDFPDGRQFVNVLPGAEKIVALLWVAILLAATGLEAFSFIRSLIKKRRPALGPGAIFVGVSWISLLLFLLNTRSTVDSYRYLLPLVLAFPFLVALLFAALPRPWRYGVGVVALLLAGMNMVMTVFLANTWRQPGFSRDQANIADIQPALQRLRELGITHACASYWASYRITYETDGAILCSQPINERFPGWRVPYKKDVDASTNVAYVLTEGISFLKPSVFDRHLASMGVTCQRENHGDFSIYYNFRESDDIAARKKVPSDAIMMSASHLSNDAGLASDANSATRWVTTGVMQQTGMWFQAELPAASRLAAIRITYGPYFHDHAPRMDLLALDGDTWREIERGILGRPDKFEFTNKHPVYGGITRQTIPLLESGSTRALRLVVTETNPRFCWSLCELEVFQSP